MFAKYRRTVVVGLTLCGLLGGSVIGASPAPARSAKSSTFYFVEAHPDDEALAWQLVDDFQQHYTVFVLLTQGERTVACLTEQEAHDYELIPKNGDTPAVGPYRYEGPNSPVGEPDEGERDPFGNPWVGMDTPECGRAKVASWHWFLDDAAALDPGFPDFGISASASGDPWADDDFKGSFCVPGHQGVGHEKHDHVYKSLGCADVWANDVGARVVFDLGDFGWPESHPEYLDPDPFESDEVIAAIETLRAHRGEWGLQLLPEAGLMAAAPGCDPIAHGVKAHRDHETIQNALYKHDFGIGPQYGAVCDGTTNALGSTIAGASALGSPDRRLVESPGTIQGPDPLEWWQINAVDPVSNQRIGPMGVDYGWIAEGSTGHWDFPFHALWKRFD